MEFYEQVSWGDAILVAVRHIADEDFQRRSWTGKGPEVSSPSELYCEIFDDCNLEKFISNPPLFVSQSSLSNLSELRDLMRLIRHDEIDDADPLKLIESPSWIKIREFAAKAAEKFYMDFPKRGLV
jgi:hypothetical protein